MDKNRLPSQALHYRPNGQRNVGLRKRWKDNFTLRIEEQATCLTPLYEHDDDDDILK
jgi:hypothetical protein